jgi:hypothetical protein
MLELLNSLTAEAVIAILGSLVTITLGAIALAKQLSSTKPSPINPPSSLPKVQREEIDQLHRRISAAKEVAIENKGELRVMVSQIDALSQRMEEHERRDIRDFKIMESKIDKMMDIVIQILQDEKL